VSIHYLSEVDPTCPICSLETETITHVITSCPIYNEIRKEHFVKIKGTVITAIGFDSWKRNFNKKDIIFIHIISQAVTERIKKLRTYYKI
jgi:hypothetical protein